MKVLLLGSAGQLGTSIILKKPKGINLIPLKKNELDISNKKQCKKIISYHKPDWIINAAAYTEVDKAEKNVELALRINRDGPKIICDILNEIGGNIIHISTDFVFDGKAKKPYLPKHPTNPISVYGFSKVEGEEEIKKIFSNYNRAIILRASWVMGPFKKNFANTMLRLHSERETLEVVSDQIGCPTSSISLANICWKIIEKKKQEINFKFPLIMHWRDAGITNWYEISEEIGRIGVQLNKLSKKAIINPISSKHYPTLAKRPSYSVLDITETQEILNIEPLDWKISILNAFQNI